MLETMIHELSFLIILHSQLRAMELRISSILHFNKQTTYDIADYSSRSHGQSST
jgi:hypothetical protein